MPHIGLLTKKVTPYWGDFFVVIKKIDTCNLFNYCPIYRKECKEQK